MSYILTFWNNNNNDMIVKPFLSKFSAYEWFSINYIFNRLGDLKIFPEFDNGKAVFLSCEEDELYEELDEFLAEVSHQYEEVTDAFIEYISDIEQIVFEIKKVYNPMSLKEALEECDAVEIDGQYFFRYIILDDDYPSNYFSTEEIITDEGRIIFSFSLEEVLTAEEIDKNVWKIGKTKIKIINFA